MFQILKQQPPQRQEHTYSIKQHELIRSLFLAMTRGLSKVLVKHAISSDYADVLVVSALCLPQCTRGASFPSLTWCALCVLKEQAFTNCASRATKQILPTHFASWCSSYGPMQEYLVSVQQAVQGTAPQLVPCTTPRGADTRLPFPQRRRITTSITVCCMPHRASSRPQPRTGLTEPRLRQSTSAPVTQCTSGRLTRVLAPTPTFSGGNGGCAVLM